MKKYIKKILNKKTQKIIKVLIYYTMHYGWYDYILNCKKDVSNKEKVSIIIPSHSNTKYVRESVMSALNQTHKNTEILIMTDVPEYGIEKELSGLLDKVKLFTEPNLKRADKTNTLTERATGDFIVLLCDDDILDKNFINNTLSILKSKKVDIVYTDVKLIGDSNGYSLAKAWKKTNFLQTTPVYITALCKKSVYKDTGGFDKNLYSYGDWDFWWTAYDMGFKAYHLKQPLFHYRIHSGQDTNTVDAARAKKEIRDKHLNKKYTR